MSNIFPKNLEKIKEAEECRRLVDEFLEKGGQIQHIKFGVMKDKEAPLAKYISNQVKNLNFDIPYTKPSEESIEAIKDMGRYRIKTDDERDEKFQQLLRRKW